LAETFAKDSKRSDEDKLNEVYLAAYARRITADEAKLATGYLSAKAADPATKRQAWEDVLWAVMSSKEFLFNH
jgi:hypothetical protein